MAPNYLLLNLAPKYLLLNMAPNYLLLNMAPKYLLLNMAPNSVVTVLPYVSHDVTYHKNVTLTALRSS